MAAHRATYGTDSTSRGFLRVAPMPLGVLGARRAVVLTLPMGADEPATIMVVGRAPALRVSDAAADPRPCAAGAHRLHPLAERCEVAFHSASGATLLERVCADTQCDTCGQVFFLVRGHAAASSRVVRAFACVVVQRR